MRRGDAASAHNFDDVADYAAYQTTGVCDIEGAAVTGLSGYNVNVSIDTADSLGGLTGAAVARKVTVKVTRSSNGESLSLVGWRTNYAAP